DAALPNKSVLLAELQIRADDSPLRLNGSGLVVLNPPWQFDQQIAPALPLLKKAMGEAGAMTRLEWLKTE
ncbi:MAG: 23S rRNA (adenine(2030)-N(6))-methyltransferase RlmJ, partial [Pseudoxanthomonas sp.]